MTANEMYYSYGESRSFLLIIKKEVMIGMKIQMKQQFFKYTEYVYSKFLTCREAATRKVIIVSKFANGQSCLWVKPWLPHFLSLDNGTHACAIHQFASFLQHALWLKLLVHSVMSQLNYIQQVHLQVGHR